MVSRVTFSSLQNATPPGTAYLSSFSFTTPWSSAVSPVAHAPRYAGTSAHGTTPDMWRLKHTRGRRMRPRTRTDFLKIKLVVAQAHCVVPEWAVRPAHRHGPASAEECGPKEGVPGTEQQRGPTRLAPRDERRQLTPGTAPRTLSSGNCSRLPGNCRRFSDRIRFSDKSWFSGSCSRFSVGSRVSNNSRSSGDRNRSSH